MPFGQSYLWVRCKDTVSPVKTKLRNDDGKVFHNGISSPFDEDNDEKTSRIKMFDANGTPYHRGMYTLDVDTQLPDAKAE